MSRDLRDLREIARGRSDDLRGWAMPGRVSNVAFGHFRMKSPRSDARAQNQKLTETEVVRLRT